MININHASNTSEITFSVQKRNAEVWMIKTWKSVQTDQKYVNVSLNLSLKYHLQNALYSRRFLDFGLISPLFRRTCHRIDVDTKWEQIERIYFSISHIQ